MCHIYTMKVILFVVCITIHISNNFVNGSTCILNGLHKEEDYSHNYYDLQIPIKDTHSGVIASFKTENILRVKVEDVDYLNVTWENQELTFFVTDKFKDYEKENRYTKEPEITVTLDCLCTKDTSEEMVIRQAIVDENTFFPELNKDRYDYVFGMSVPEKNHLTEVIPIIVTDHDITNSQVVFKITDNEFVKLDEEIVKSRTKKFVTNLIVKKNLTAPVNEELTLTVTDNGFPMKTVTVPLTLVVVSPEGLEKLEGDSDENENAIHPPVFEGHVYFASYDSNNQFKMDETIRIKYGARNETKLKQLGYEEYFNIDFQDNTNTIVKINNIKQLSAEIVENNELISILIEAKNDQISIPGRTSLLVSLPKLDRNNDNSVEQPKGKHDIVIKYGYFADTGSVLFILFLIGILSIVFTNVFVIIMFFNQKKDKH